MTEVVKAKRTTIAIAGISIEVFQLPDGSYVMSQTQVAEAVKIPEVSVRRFLVSETAKAVLGKDFTFDTLSYSDGDQGRGNSGAIKTLPLNAATAFWVVQSTKGNEKARALVNACAMEALERRCDSAFDVRKSEAQYEDETQDAYERWLLAREFAYNSHGAFQNACKLYLFDAAKVHDELTLGLTGMTASMHKMMHCQGDDETVGLDHVNSARLLNLIGLAKQAFAGYRTGTAQERIERAIKTAKTTRFRVE